MTKYIDFLCQSCANFQDMSTLRHLMKYILFEHNLFNHFRVTLKNASVAFILPLYVCMYD